MREDVRTFLAQCPHCQKQRESSIKVATLPYANSVTTRPMSVLNIDTVGPLKESFGGLKYVVVIIDMFTRFVELYAVPDASAKAAVNAMLQHFGRYGCPRTILSDNGSQYVNDLVAKFLDMAGTEHNRTLAYSKEENGIVERANKEFMRHLRALLQSVDHRSWPDYLPMAQRIVNATVHSSIGMSPYQLLYGDTINLEEGIFMPFKTPDATPLNEWITGNCNMPILDGIRFQTSG